MKDLVLLPLRFVAVLIAFLLLSTGVQVLIDYSLLPPAVTSNESFSIVPMAFQRIFDFALPSVALTWLASAFHVLHRKKLRALMLILLGLVTLAAVFAGLSAKEPLLRLSRTSVDTSGFQVPEDKILTDGKGFVIIRQDNRADVAGVVYHGIGPGEHFQFIKDGKKEASTRTVLFPEEGLALETDAVLGGRDSMFRAPIFFSDFMNAVKGAIDRIFEAAGDSPLTRLAQSIGLALYLTGLWLLVRATKWPLFNVFLTLAAVIGFFFLANLFLDPGFQSVFTILPSELMPFLFPGLCAILGILMLSVNLFLSPVKDWQREAAA